MTDCLLPALLKNAIFKRYPRQHKGILGPTRPMPRPSASNVRSSGRRRVIIFGALLMVPLSAALLWWCRDALAHRDARKAHLSLEQGRIDEAAFAIERWLKSAPDSADAHYMKARLAWAQHDLSTVDRELTQAERLGYSWHQLARLRGLLLARGSQKSEAEAMLRWQFDHSSEPDSELAEALARLYLGTYRLGDAAAVIDRWMREAPKDALPYLLRAEIDLRNHASSEVMIGLYQAALKRDSSLDQARFGLAGQLYSDRRFAEAATEYAAYMARKPEDPLGYLRAGQNALDMGDLPAARALLDKALALAPHDSEVLAAQATLELRGGRIEKALHFFEQSIKIDPFDHWNHYQRMLILARQGRKAEAEEERQNVERLKREHARFGEISDGLLRNPLDMQLRGEAARWLMEHGHHQEAVDWANLVLQADPSDPAMNRLLADHYRKNGQLGLANFYEAPIARPDGKSALRTP
jgi:tetratricopeptide (TPR) repeat protein